MIMVVHSRDCEGSGKMAEAFYDKLDLPKELLEIEIIKSTKVIGSCDALILFIDKGSALEKPKAISFLEKLIDIPVITMIEGENEGLLKAAEAEALKDNFFLGNHFYKEVKDDVEMEEVYIAIEKMKEILF